MRKSLVILCMLLAVASTAQARMHFGILTDLSAAPRERAWIDVATAVPGIGVRFKVYSASGPDFSNVQFPTSPNLFVTSADSTISNLLVPTGGAATLVEADTVDLLGAPNAFDSVAVLHQLYDKEDAFVSLPTFEQLHSNLGFVVGAIDNPTFLYVAALFADTSVQFQYGVEIPTVYNIPADSVIRIPITKGNTLVTLSGTNPLVRLLGLVVVQTKKGVVQTVVGGF